MLDIPLRRVICELSRSRYTSRVAPQVQPIDAETHSADALLRLLRLGRALGLIGLLGGLASLASMWMFGPRPDDLAQWRLLVGLMRAVFYPCVFAGIVVLVAVGLSLWWRRRRELRGRRWFHVFAIGLFIAIPALHLSSRYAALSLYRAVDANDLAAATQRWDRLGLLFSVGFLVMLALSALVTIKPRLGQRERRQ